MRIAFFVNAALPGQLTPSSFCGHTGFTATSSIYDALGWARYAHGFPGFNLVILGKLWYAIALVTSTSSA